MAIFYLLIAAFAFFVSYRASYMWRSYFYNFAIFIGSFVLSMIVAGLLSEIFDVKFNPTPSSDPFATTLGYILMGILCGLLTKRNKMRKPFVSQAHTCMESEKPPATRD